MSTKKEAPANGGKRRARTEADKLKESGISASRINLTLIDPAALTLITDPTHSLYDPRVEWPVDPSDPFYKDIATHGVRDPIKVRKNGERNGVPILQVVDGRQRVQTLLHLNNTQPLADGPRRIKVEFIHGDDGQMVLTSLSTNHQRKDETPFSRAVKIQKAKALGRSNGEIAQACRWRTVVPVEQHLLILNFISEVQSAFNGELAVGLVSTFAKVPREDQLKTLLIMREGGAKTKRQVKAVVEAVQTGTEYVAPVGGATISTERIRKMLSVLTSEETRAMFQFSPHERRNTEGAIAILEHLLGNLNAFDGLPTLRMVLVSASEAAA